MSSPTVVPEKNNDSVYVAWPLAPRPQAATFHPFPRLPAELRIQIWTYALPAARVVPIRKRFVVAGSDRTPYSLVSNERRLTQRHLACMESWSIFLEHYQKIKLRNPADPVGMFNAVVQGYIDMKRDTLSMHAATLYHRQSLFDLSLLEHIAVTHYRHIYPSYATGSFWLLAKSMSPKLRSFTCVLEAAGTPSLFPRSSVRSYYLLDVDSSLQYATTLRTTSETYYMRPMKLIPEDSYMQPFWNLAPLIRQRFEADREDPRFQKLIFRICLLMLREPPGPRGFAQRLELSPVHEVPYPVSFYTYKPIAQSTDSLLCMNVTELSQRVLCLKKNGTLETRYDGIEHLYEEDVSTCVEKDYGGTLEHVRFGPWGPPIPLRT